VEYQALVEQILKDKKVKNILKITLFCSGLVVAGCTQQSVPEMSQYNGQRIELLAKATPGLIDAEFVLFINREQVIKQRTKPFGGSSQTFKGTWNGRNVVARVTAVSKFMSHYTMIDVFIDGVLVDTLTV